MTALGPRLLLDLGRVEQRRDDRGRADSHGHSGLHQLGASLLVGPVVVVAVAHAGLSMAFLAGWEAA